MEKRENPAAVRSKKALALALADLLEERSLSEITVADITDKAGLSRQTFYTNFSKKEEILDYSLKRLFDIYREHIKEAPEISEPKSVLTDYFSFWYEHRKFLSMLFGSGLGHLFFIMNSDFFSQEFKRLAENAAAEEKEIPYIMEYLAGLSFTLLQTWIIKGMELSADQLTDLMNKLLTGSIFS